MLVSVCTIARNEEEYLPHLLGGIIKTGLPGRADRSVMDGQQFDRWNQTDYGTFCRRKSAVS